MMSTAHRFVFLHVPKTAENTLQSLLLPFSDDAKQVVRHQDGTDRFEIRGPVTPRKHATLADYAARLGDRLDTLAVAISVRHPVPRAISAYFSPNAWMREAAPGRWEAERPVWDEARFETMLASPACRPATAFLQTEGGLRRPDHAIRTEHLETDLRAMVTALGLPLDLAVLPRLNASAAPEAQRRLLADPALCAAIEARYADDMDFFGYDRWRAGG